MGLLGMSAAFLEWQESSSKTRKRDSSRSPAAGLSTSGRSSLTAPLLHLLARRTHDSGIQARVYHVIQEFFVEIGL